ncbi:hypothetical protein SAMN05518672_102695 [Chitinophaga sp. CF118]|uniref:hypothetical protein n=1 Tax=Chitinophaga sp. CF118 TaxID=1884367 RepID=UPI0008E1BDFF|nr:hypothetical protein [Chitinophaga sp. CF118]SFD63032.1 hypothetical protein SAMN05518672_102695 [Chitinophaga sp. CF118]
MKNLLFPFFGMLTVASFMFSGCSKQDSKSAETPQNAATVAYNMTAVNPSGTVTTDAAGAGRLSTIMNNPSIASIPSLRFDLTWDSILVRFRELKFMAKSGPDEINLSIKTDRVIDILDSVSLGSIMLPTGNFEKVKVYVRAEGDSIVPAVWMKGRITWQGTDIPLEIVMIGKIELWAKGTDVAISQTGISLNGDLKIDLNVVLTKLQIGDFEGTFDKGKLKLTINLDKDGDNQIKTAFESSMSVEHKRK